MALALAHRRLALMRGARRPTRLRYRRPPRRDKKKKKKKKKKKRYARFFSDPARPLYYAAVMPLRFRRRHTSMALVSHQRAVTFLLRRCWLLPLPLTRTLFFAMLRFRCPRCLICHYARSISLRH
jgi:hypothetical protein